jgi:glycosyltransferase involved in cell wall biosynthesis
MRLAGALADRGHAVDLVICFSQGACADQVPDNVRRVVLPRVPKRLARLLPLVADPAALGLLTRAMLSKARPSPTMAHLWGLSRYLRRERPSGLVAAGTDLNLEAVWARRLAATPMRLLICEHIHLSSALAHANTWRQRNWPGLVRRTYPAADGIVAVSRGVAQDLSALIEVAGERISVIYNPVVGPDVAGRAREPVSHPWLAPGCPPVVLGAGRLVADKDFASLVCAVARLRRAREVRLVILGEGKAADRDQLLALANELGCANDVDIPGFVHNPFAYMARAAVFALSSRLEGFGNVLVEAMACGCPVVSTDCRSGPDEILDGGRYGRLVPVGDSAALADALALTLTAPPPRELLIGRAQEFSIERAAIAYEALLIGDGGSHPAHA